ncbi:site-2 protease family protein [Candidatus Kaiserbacteria bacterium]|nr:site-2 protease family protein [Candidatus Kaiserbacteria bacterium]
METLLLVIGILVFLIVVHELGHFVAAKIARVKVEEFGIGYPPRAFTFGKFRGTEYTLNWIPFGGFVRLFGDVGEGQHGAGSLVDANRAVQALILVAGVSMNVLAAWGLYAGALHEGVPRAVEAPVAGEIAQLMISSVVPGSPADAAGLAAGDEILGLEDEDTLLATLTPEAFSDFVRAHPGEPITLTYLHAGEQKTTDIIPAHAVVPDEAGRAALGVGVVLVSARPLPWGEAVVEAFGATKKTFVTVLRGLGSIARRALAGLPAFSEVVGPIGLVGVVGDAAENGVGSVLALAAFISVNLAVINLIPIPALDGGRLVLLGVEATLRRSAPKLALQALNAFGFALIIVLMITVTFNDISRLLT